MIPAGAEEPQRLRVRGDHAEVFRELFERAPDAIVAVNRDGVIVLANAQSEHLFGYTREELTGRSIEALIPKRHAQEHERLRAGYFANPRARPMGAGLEPRALRSDGKRVSDRDQSLEHRDGQRDAGRCCGARHH